MNHDLPVEIVLYDGTLVEAEVFFGSPETIDCPEERPEMRIVRCTFNGQEVVLSKQDEARAKIALWEEAECRYSERYDS